MRTSGGTKGFIPKQEQRKHITFSLTKGESPFFLSGASCLYVRASDLKFTVSQTSRAPRVSAQTLLLKPD